MITLNLPQIALIFWLSAEVVASYVKHGQPKEGRFAYFDGNAQLFSVSAIMLLLYWGGFFS